MARPMFRKTIAPIVTFLWLVRSLGRLLLSWLHFYGSFNI